MHVFHVSFLLFLAYAQMYEAKKVADWTNKMAKIEEASRKKDELNNEFILQTSKSLVNKMEQSEEKRDAIISDLKEKLKVSRPNCENFVAILHLALAPARRPTQTKSSEPRR
jgi:hypothetical protein